MTSPTDASERKVHSADHADSVLCRLLIAHPEVVDIEILGQTDLPEGIIYSGRQHPGAGEGGQQRITSRHWVSRWLARSNRLAGG